MAKIKPFRAIRPNPFYADQLVLTKPQSVGTQAICEQQSDHREG